MLADRMKTIAPPDGVADAELPRRAEAFALRPRPREEAAFHRHQTRWAAEDIWLRERGGVREVYGGRSLGVSPQKGRAASYRITTSTSYQVWWSPRGGGISCRPAHRERPPPLPEEGIMVRVDGRHHHFHLTFCGQKIRRCPATAPPQAMCPVCQRTWRQRHRRTARSRAGATLRKTLIRALA